MSSLMTHDVDGPPTTGAALKTALTGLGLTVPALADAAHVSLRTAHRWCDTDGPIGDPAAALALDRLRGDMNDYVDELVAAAAAAGDVIYTYRTQAAGGKPASWHRAAAFKAADRLDAMGVRVTIAYVD